MIDPLTFFKAFGILFVTISLFLGVVYWMVVMFRRSFPDFRFWFKYSILRKKHNEKDVLKLLKYQEKGMTIPDLKRFLLLSGFDLKRTREYCYIYKKIQEKMQEKGGKTK